MLIHICDLYSVLKFAAGSDQNSAGTFITSDELISVSRNRSICLYVHSKRSKQNSFVCVMESQLNFFVREFNVMICLQIVN